LKQLSGSGPYYCTFVLPLLLCETFFEMMNIPLASPEDIPVTSCASTADGTVMVAPEEDTTHPQVQVDMSHIIVGRIKEAPVCVDAGLKQEAMSAEELSKFAFSTARSTSSKTKVVTPSTSASIACCEPSVVSSGSSTASRESSDLSDLDGAVSAPPTSVISSPNLESSPSSSWTLTAREEESERINHKVTTQKMSRNGRQSQRWYTDPVTQRLYRLTTGCVPVVGGGKILFVSSSRKPEWILPKGGWEMDEAMEESAIREAFEEAGVLGILGPMLGEIEYETRKAKKRRLEFEEVQRKASREANSPSPAKSSTSVSTYGEGSKIAHDGDSCSVASDHSQSYTHVKMKLFPLYVTDVRKSWPEEGRFRKAVDIDEAIRMTESRPELQSALKELKERNLHIPQLASSATPLPPKIQEPSVTLTVSFGER
jgi:diphosphoinositol-polyphosphate diphosphatase